MSTLALNKLWEYIQVLSLSNSDKDWLAAKIIESKQDAQEMPCTFTDEEWKEEIRLSMAEGDATEEETKAFYDKWAIAL